MPKRRRLIASRRRPSSCAAPLKGARAGSGGEASLSTPGCALAGLRAAQAKRKFNLWDEPDPLAEPRGDFLPDPIESIDLRAVRRVGDKAEKLLPTRLSVDFDGSSPYLPDNIEVDVVGPDVTRARVAPLKIFGNSVLAYDRDLDRGIQHEIEAVRLEVPLGSVSAGNDPILARASAQADLEAGFRHRSGNNTGYAQLHARAEAQLELDRTVSLGGRADAWLMAENTGVRCDVELNCGARVKLDSNPGGPRLEAGYSRFYTDILSSGRSKDEDFDAVLFGITIGR